MAKERILITGASLGIGLELAKVAARDGKDLILVARSGDKLRELAAQLQYEHGISATVIAADLVAPGAAERLYQEVKAQGLQVDMLINNAGFGMAGPFVKTDRAEELGSIQLNVAVLTELTKLFLPDMLSRGRGRIMNVASVAAFVPGPYMAVYHATKAYVLSLTDALAAELKGTGVTLTALCPGPSHTGFAQRSGMQFSLLLRMALTDAAYIARAGYAAMMRGKRVVIPGALNWVITILPRLFPRPWITAIASKVNSVR